MRYSSITAIVLSTLYGMELAEENDPNVAIFETGLQSVEFLISNSSWVEYLPLRVIENLPTWLPGMSIIRRLAEIHEAAMIIRNMPWKHSKDALVRALPSLSKCVSVAHALLQCALAENGRWDGMYCAQYVGTHLAVR